MVHELDTVVITKDLFQDTIQAEYMNTITPLGALAGLGVPVGCLCSSLRSGTQTTYAPDSDFVLRYDPDSSKRPKVSGQARTAGTRNVPLTRPLAPEVAA